MGHVCLKELQTPTASHKNAVVSSSILALQEYESFLQTRKPGTGDLRIQVSWGAEFHRYYEKLLPFLDARGGVDILIDRPLDYDAIEELRYLRGQFDIRLCLIANRYFDFWRTVSSLEAELLSSLVVVFLPPADAKSAYYSPDEVIGILEGGGFTGEITLLVFDNILSANVQIPDFKFFLEMDREAYFSGSLVLETFKTYRALMVWGARKNLIWLLDSLYAVLMFMKSPSWQGLLNPILTFRCFVVQHLKKLGWVVFHFFRYSVFHFFRYKIPHYFRISVLHFLRFRLLHFIRIWILQPLRYRIVPQVKGNLIRWGVCLMVVFRYRAPHLLRTVMNFVLYPLYKIYWFSNYQFKKRVLPYFKKGVPGG